MNIIYKLTNKTKNTFPKYYIGCKTDCTITNINGVNTIINTVTNRPYYGSSLNNFFAEDLSSGHIFEAEVLEIVPKKENLMNVEANWLQKVNACNNNEYYNLSNGFQTLSKPDKVVNIYGEVLKDYAMRQSNFSKKRNTAKELGFKSILDFSLFTYYKRIENKNWAETRIVESPQENDKNYYWVRVKTEKNKTFNYYIYQETFEIKFLDTINNKILTLEEWRKQK